MPGGNTEFKLSAGDLNFHSTGYDWLVVDQTGKRAQLSGTGTVNGDLAPDGESYRFMIWIEDGSSDTFRIRIWWADGSGSM